MLLIGLRLRQGHSPATWRKMLAKQVPQQLATACVKAITNALAALSTANSSNSTATSNRRHTPAASASHIVGDHNERLHMVNSTVLSVMCCLADRACSDLHMDTDEPTAAGNDKAAAFGQQIHAADFVQLLPQVMDSLAQRMQDATGLTTAQFTPQQQGSASSNGARVAAPAIDRPLALPVLASLRLYAALNRAWAPSVFVTEIAPAATHPLLRLCWLLMRYTDAKLQQVYESRDNGPIDTAVLVPLGGLWVGAYEAACSALVCIAIPDSQAACAQHSTEQHQARIFASPHALPCLAYAIAGLSYALLLTQLPTLPTASEVAGGIWIRMTVDKTETALAAAAAWQLACRDAVRIPAVHSVLLQHSMGCHAFPVLFCACRLLSDFLPQLGAEQQFDRPAAVVDAALISQMYAQLEGYFTCYMVLANSVSEAVEQGGAAPAMHSATSLQAPWHLLMSSLLFYWAAHQPARLPSEAGDSTQAADCSTAVSCSSRALHHAALCDPQPPPEWLLWRMHENLVPLVTVVGRTVLHTLGLGRRKKAGSASSSSSGSQSATAISSRPSLTAMHCAIYMVFLPQPPEQASSEGKLVLVGQLVEAAARDWQQIQQYKDLASIAGMLQYVLKRLIKNTDGLGSSSSSSSGPRSSRAGGQLLAAAQTQRTLHTESDNTLTPPQLQLASLCFSVLKMLMTIQTANPAVCNTAGVLQCCQLVAQAASSMLSWLADCGPVTHSTSAVSAQEAVAAAVPWLALSGRVLQYVATQLPATGTATAGSTTAPGASHRVKILQLTANSACGGVRTWLQAEGADDALATAGYTPSGSLLQQIMAETVDVTELQSLCCALPFACACNNPACANLAGPAEVQLVGGKSCICSGCHVARYCSRACQVQAWKQQHKPVCRAVAAAAVAVPQPALQEWSCAQ